MYKYFQIPMTIWLLSILTLITVIVIQNQKLNQMNKEYLRSSENKSASDLTLWKNIKDIRKENVNLNKGLSNIVGFCTVLTFLLQIVGLKKGNKRKLYKWTSIVFGLLSVVYLCLLLFIKIIPIGPII